MKNKQKGFVKLIVVIVLIVIGILVYNFFEKRNKPFYDEGVAQLPEKNIVKEDQSVSINVVPIISSGSIKGDQNSNRLYWDKQIIGKVSVDVVGNLENQKSYFLPGNFACIPGEDRPIYLTYSKDGKSFGPMGGLAYAIPGNPQKIAFDLSLESSATYIKDFSQYISSPAFKDYKWVDYSQKGFDVGSLKLPIKVGIYSYSKTPTGSINCSSIKLSEVSKISEISIVK